MFLIYISGIDGCGKTTQSKLLAQWLREQGLNAEYHWLRWEPSVRGLIVGARRLLGGGRCETNAAKEGVANAQHAAENRSFGRWSQLKRRLFASAIFRKVWLAYACRDYFGAYLRAVRGWNADILVLDRYVFDFVVDQSLNCKMEVEAFEKLLEGTALREMRRPDLRIFIDLDAATGHGRKRDGTPLAYLQEREPLYREVASSQTVLHVNGDQSVEEIHRIIREWVGSMIGGAKA